MALQVPPLLLISDQFPAVGNVDTVPQRRIMTRHAMPRRTMSCHAKSHLAHGLQQNYDTISRSYNQI